MRQELDNLRQQTERLSQNILLPPQCPSDYTTNMSRQRSGSLLSRAAWVQHRRTSTLSTLSLCSRLRCHSKVIPRLKGLINQEFGPSKIDDCFALGIVFGYIAFNVLPAMVLFYVFSVWNPLLKNTKLGKPRDTKVE